jgi:hypothetical protein
METLGTEPVEENQHAMQLLIRDLVLAGMIIEGTEGAILEVLRKLMEDEDITEEDKISVLRQLREGADAGRNGLTQERKADSMRRGRSYMPDIDGRDRIGRLLGRGLLLPMAIFRHYTKMIILEQHGYSFNGESKGSHSNLCSILANQPS